MDELLKHERALGINGVGRIGKLVFWQQISQGYFDRLVLNTGRKVGRTLADAIDYLTHDSTYGTLGRFLYGYGGKRCHDFRVERRSRHLHHRKYPSETIA